MEIQQVQSIVSAFQNLMQQKGSSIQAQWNELAQTQTNILSKSVFLQRLSSFGLDLTNDEVDLLWDHFNMRPKTIDYSDFEKIMKATFHSGSQYEYPNNYTQSRPFTASPQRTTSYNQQYQSGSPRERPMNSQMQSPGSPQNDRQELIRRTRDYNSDDNDDLRSHNYYTCRSIKQREGQAMPASDLRTLDTLSNTSIQRQQYDGPTSTRKSFKTKSSLKRTLATISDIAYSADPSSWSCFLKWRNPTKETIDASDLLGALQREQRVSLSLADVQQVINKYGPLNHNTFKLMLTEGHRYSLYKDFDDDDDY